MEAAKQSDHYKHHYTAVRSAHRQSPANLNTIPLTTFQDR